MTYIKLNYYSHLLLNSKYSLLIKLAIIFSIYALFYLDSSTDIAYCTKLTKQQLIEKTRNLEIENSRLKNELNRFRMTVDPNSYRELETLDTLKERIEIYRTRNAAGFLTVEEQERPTYVNHIGHHRPDLKFDPSFYNSTKYENVTTNLINQHRLEQLVVDQVTIDETGKQIFDLHRHYRVSRYDYTEYSRFSVGNSNFFYDYTDHFREVYYPANHPDNNFDPQYKRLRKLVGREFYEKQLPDKISDNCNIS